MPNLVLIMSDEARKDVLYHDKYAFVRTPNIDALRAEAVTFRNCFANYPVCVPSRASVITGRYPHQLGVLHNTHRLPAGERDLGHHLTAHGYDCVAFGKTHGTNRGFRSVTYDKVAAMGFDNHGYLEDPELITGVFEGPAEEYCDLVSDHGDQLGEHGMAGKMGNLYEASIRVPLVIRLPGAAHAGAERGQLAEMVDLFPTICDLLGVPHPGGPQALAGRSLAPLVADPAAEHRRIVHAMLLEGRMARTESLKLNFYADERGELYDLATDPDETVNRYDEPAYRDRRHELVAEITRFLIRYPRVAEHGKNEYFG